MSEDFKVGIVATGMYLPETVMTGDEIAAASGLPPWVVKHKLGITQKLVVEGLDRRVDPAEAHSLVDGGIESDRRVTAALLPKDKPDARRRSVVGLEPFPEFGRFLGLDLGGFVTHGGNATCAR